LAERIGPRFPRSEPRQQALAYLQGLLSSIERKNSWQLAEQAGDPGPHRFQHLLGRAVWEADAMRDDLQAYVREHLADPEAVLIVDETGFLKKGEGSVGVQRQYSGTAGRIENCQIGVFLAYQGARGHTFLDRALYMPAEWAGDKPRRDAAGVPEEIRFATKPVLARQMIERALADGVSARWVSGDSVYGNDGKLRLWLEEQQRAHVLGVSGNHFVVIGWEQQKVSMVAAQFPPEVWQRWSAGAGSKGPRWYEWAAVETNSLLEGWARWLLVRRSVEDAQERAYYRVFAPVGTTLKEMVAVAGKRWAVEECFAAAKGECGLDQYEVRSLDGLASACHAFSAGPRLSHRGAGAERRESAEKKKPPRKNALIALSVPEIRHLLWRLVWQKTVEQSLVLAWSLWRRKHQAKAQFYHYRRRNRSG
jgi:SRSO17 transposase